jgi:hypothetical protein
MSSTELNAAACNLSVFLRVLNNKFSIILLGWSDDKNKTTGGV